MKNDSNLLFNNMSHHNSVYLGGFVLEGYVKILLIKNGANEKDYFGHIKGCNCKIINRLNTLNPTELSSSILIEGNEKYPWALLSDKYDINFRYEISQWKNSIYCNRVQKEINDIINELNDLRIKGSL